MSDVRWWKERTDNSQDEWRSEQQVPSENVTDEADGIPSQTGDEPPDVAHDDTEDLAGEARIRNDQPDPKDPDLPTNVSDR